jgi:hypothetical protein
MPGLQKVGQVLAAVARQHLPHLLEAGHLVDQTEQALLGRGIRGKFELLHYLGGEPSVGEALEEELEGIPDEGAPSFSGIWNEDLDGNEAADPLADFGAPVRAAPAFERHFHGGDAASGIAVRKHARP